METIHSKVDNIEMFEKIVSKIRSLPKSIIYNLINSEKITNLPSKDGFTIYRFLIQKDNSYLWNVAIENSFLESRLEEFTSLLKLNSSISVVDTNEKLVEAQKIIENFEIIALDTETYPYYPTIDGVVSKKPITLLSLMQICVSEQTSFKDRENKRKFCFVIDFMENINLDFLKSILISKKYIKIFHNASYDVGRIQEQTAILLDNVWCTMVAERSKLGEKKGLKLSNLAKTHLSIDMDKTLQQSSWHVRPLSEGQFVYSILDSTILLDIYHSQIEKGDYVGWYSKNTNNKKKKYLLDDELETQTVLDFILPDKDRKYVDWLKDFIISGNARSFQPSEFCLNGRYLINNVYDFSQDILALILNTDNIKTTYIFNGYSLNDLLIDFYIFCQEKEQPIERCLSCTNVLYGKDSLEYQKCFTCYNNN